MQGVVIECLGRYCFVVLGLDAFFAVLAVSLSPVAFAVV
jgi:hypothetical protein